MVTQHDIDCGWRNTFCVVENFGPQAGMVHDLSKLLFGQAPWFVDNLQVDLQFTDVVQQSSQTQNAQLLFR